MSKYDSIKSGDRALEIGVDHPRAQQRDLVVPSELRYLAAWGRARRAQRGDAR